MSRATAERRAEERAAYADRMLHLTSLVVGAVHDDGPDAVREAIASALAAEQPDGEDPVEWLAATLAAQVDPDSTPSERLGWVSAGDTVQLRDNDLDARRLDWLLSIGDTGHPLEVPDYKAMTARCVEGLIPLDRLPEECQLIAVEICRRRSLSTRATARRLQSSPQYVQRARTKWRDRHGIPMPPPSAGGAGGVCRETAGAA